tara:strand:+ start:434 stop:550 length:117 start_codon:yes stop_codon:yes gene_type:complete
MIKKCSENPIKVKNTQINGKLGLIGLSEKEGSSITLCE